MRTDPSVTHQVLEATLVSADISGFTKLSERLAGMGKQGAEELTDLLNECFDGMISICGAFRGDVLKFGGDALLVLFRGDGHAERACHASVGMRESIARPLVAGSGRRVSLRMSIGAHSGRFALYLVDAGHQELIVTGPAATRTVVCEGEANAGQILVSDSTASLVERAWLGARHPVGRLLRAVRARQGSVVAEPWPEESGPPLNLAELVAPAQREQISAGVHGEHRQVTTAFIKFSGTDGLHDDAGPEEVARRLQTVASVVHEAVDRHGIHWLASDIYPDGGKIILTAGAPSSFGDDEERMLWALRDILDADQPITLRAGVNRGHVFAGDLGSPTRRTYTVMGDAVNLAARLMQKAEPGQLIATRHLLARARSRFVLEPLEPFAVKGKSMPIEAASVGAVEASAGAASAIDTSLPFVGRQPELDSLLVDVTGARRGRGTFVDVVGEPGIGKTRLLQELQSRASGMVPITVWCQPYLATTPYGSAAILLRTMAGIGVDEKPLAAGELLKCWVTKVAPDFLPWLPLLAIPFGAEVPATPEADSIDIRFRRSRIHVTVADLLTRALPVPAVVRIEDGHFLDDASRELLVEVLDRLDSMPWVVAVTSLPGSAPVTPRLSGRLLTVGPLDNDAARALAAAAVAVAVAIADPDASVVEVVADRAGGHPLFTVELAAAARAQGSTDALPDSIEAAVTSRIDTLTAADRMRLREASVLGVRFDPAVFVEALGDQLPAEVRWDTMGSVVTVEPGGLVHFRHNLVHRVVYEALSYRRRRAVHHLVGLALERRSADGAEDLSDLLSLHFSRAEDHRRTWRYSVVAGRKAQAAYANIEAAEFYSRALTSAQHLPDLPPLDIAEVAEALGDVRELAGDYRGATGAYTEARRAAAGPMRARLLRKEGIIRERTGRYTQALRWYGRGLRLLSGSPETDPAPTAPRIELSLAYSGVRFRQGRYRECARWARAASVDAEQAGERRSQAHALYLLALASNLLAERQNEDYGARALEIFEELGDHVGQANVLNNRAIAAYYAGRWNDALELYERSRVQRELAGDVVGAATAQNNVGEILSDQGRLEEAVSLFKSARQDFERYRYALGVAVATSNLGRAEGRAGRPGPGLALLDVARRQLTDMGAAAFVLETEARRAECLVLEGRGAEAVSETSELLERLGRSGGDELVKVSVMRTRSWALRQTGEDGAARRLLEDAVALATSVEADYELALCLDALSDFVNATENISDNFARAVPRIIHPNGCTITARAATGFTHRQGPGVDSRRVAPSADNSISLRPLGGVQCSVDPSCGGIWLPVPPWP